MKIAREFEFAMGHTITGHSGKCKNLHGHNYRLIVQIEGRIHENGMVVDFGDMKDIVNAVVDARLDHKFMIWQEDPRTEGLRKIDGGSLVIVPFEPTAENIVQWIRKELNHAMESGTTFEGMTISELELWETKNCYARC